MKKVFFIFVIGLLASCQKRYELDSLEIFNIRTEKSSYSVRDTVRFIIDGDPENIVFWSGETGSKYEYRNRTAIEGNTINLNFKSFSQFATADRSIIQLKVSTDFSGTVDAANIQKANWTDISDIAQWSTGADQTPSGNINLDAFASQNKEIAVAFYHKTTVLKPLAQQNRWVIRSFDITSTNAEQGTSTSILTLANAAWKGYRFNAADPKTAWSIAAAQLITGRSETELYEDWCVSKLFNPNKVDTDKGVAIKNISAKKVTTYEKVYPVAGVYKVVFVAANGNVENTRSITREIELTITP